MARSVNAILRKHANAKLKAHTVAPSSIERDDTAWLAQNYREVAVAPPAPGYIPASRTEVEDYNGFNAFLQEWEHNESHDVKGSTIAPTTGMVRPEPKSIYSPAGTPRIRREGPAKRRAAERNERDCELPADKRSRQTIEVYDGRMRHTATMSINPFNRTFTIAGPRFKSGQSIADKRKAR